MSLKRTAAFTGIMVFALGLGARAQTANEYDIAQHCYGECHGPDTLAEHPDWPSIAGQKVEYITKQLTDFRRTGQASVHMLIRSDPRMNNEASALDENILGLVATVIADTPCERHPHAVKQPLAMPQAAADCASCHGEDGQGTYRHIPILAGQSAAYLQKQLALLKSYQPHSHEQKPGDMRNFKVMAEHTMDVPDTALREIANYYSSLPCD